MRAGEEQLQAWMIAALDGSRVDYGHLLGALAPLLRDYFRHRSRGRDADMEDLVQETLIAVHTRRATYDRSRSFTPWLYAIARYKMIDHFRRARHLVQLDAGEQSISIPSFAEASDARLDVEELLAGLPSKQARAIRSTHIEGRSVAETASAQGIGQSDVKISVHRGLKALRRRVMEGR